MSTTVGARYLVGGGGGGGVGWGGGIKWVSFGGSLRSRTITSGFSNTKTRPHVTGVFGHQKRRFSNTSPEERCGRTKTEVFKYDDDDVMPWFIQGSFFRTYDSKTLRVDTDFF